MNGACPQPHSEAISIRRNTWFQLAVDFSLEGLMAIDRQTEKDRIFLAMCKFNSLLSKDPSTKVGAMVVRDDGTICSTGYNGFPRKISDLHSLLENRATKYPRMIHAEMNALHFARESVEGGTMYVWPFSPCHVCAPHIIQRGISRIVSINTSEDLKSRWDDSLEVAKELFDDGGVELVLYPEDFLDKITNEG